MNDMIIQTPIVQSELKLHKQLSFFVMKLTQWILPGEL